jgi:hypothetical protein
VADHEREKQQLETEIAAERASWEQESERAERDRKEQEDLLRKQRQREIEDYEYKKSLERKKAQDRYDEDVRLAEKKNQEKQEALGKGWQQREAALKEREEELARLRKEVEAFPGRLQKEAQAAAEQARRQTEAQFEQQTVLMKKDAESDKRLSALQIKTLEEMVVRLQAQIAVLEKQLADSKQQVQDIAVKAIEGASGARALGHINQIAMEQAKNRPQGSWLAIQVVGAAGFEPATSCAQGKRATRLRHAPTRANHPIVSQDAPPGPAHRSRLPVRPWKHGIHPRRGGRPSPSWPRHCAAATQPLVAAFARPGAPA